MDNFHGTQVDVMAPAQIHLATVKFWHAVGGLYIWEYFTTFDYEWKVLRGRLPYRWTIWLYSISRLTALLSIIFFFVILNVTAPIDCQPWMVFAILFSCLSATTASLLIVIRTIAIWNRNKVAVALASIVWGINIGFHLYNIAPLRFTWIYADQTCGPARSGFTELGFIPTIIADWALLLIILPGVLVLRTRGGGTFGLTRLLWRQGVIWLALGSAFEIPPLVFSLLHLNGPLHTVFDIPCLIIMTIATTRMHRSLVGFASGPSEVRQESQESRPMSSLVFARTKRSDIARTILDRIKVSVHRVSEQHSGSKNESDFTTATSASERVLPITDDSLKLDLDLTQESSHSLPTVSASPILGAQNV